MSEHHELCPSRIGVECICFEIANTERERIIKLLDKEWLVPSMDTPHGRIIHRDSLIALIKGEK